MRKAEATPGSDRSLPPDYRIRAYETADAAALAMVEARASVLFAEYGFPSLVPSQPPAPETLHAFAAAHETFVAEHAENGAVGYAVVHPLDRFLHLRELAVDPAHGRRGVGTALLRHAVEKSAREGYAGMSLTTFRRLPFNEHFYASNGFVECPLGEAPPALAEQFHTEVPPGIDPATRLLMLRDNAMHP
jgi:GNAT superfamily N-acetyltransferase